MCYMITSMKVFHCLCRSFVKYRKRILSFPYFIFHFNGYLFSCYVVQVKEVFAAIAPAVGLRVGLAVGQSSLADEISELIRRPKLEMCSSFDPDDIQMEPQTSVDILVATPGRLMDHINMTKGFSLEHLCYLVDGSGSYLPYSFSVPLY